MTLTHEDHGPVLRIQHPEDLLALIPHELGHRPRDECVLAVTGGDTGFLLLAMAQPPAGAPPEVVGGELAEALEHVPGVSDVIVVVYRESVPECPVNELAALTVQWEQIVRTVGVELLTVLLVTPQFWWDPAQPDVARTSTLVEESPVNAQLIALGSALEPPAPGDDPRWQKALREKARELDGPGSVTTPEVETRGQEPRSATTGGEPRPGADAAPRGCRSAGTPRSSGTPGPGAALPCGPTALAVWERTLQRVQRRRRDWVTAVLETPAADLRGMLDGLRDEATRTCLFYAWLCGERARAESAWLALAPALARVHGGPEGPEPAGETVKEALRCVVAVAGEWDGPPHWESVETAYRILQVLDAVTHARADQHRDRADHDCPRSEQGHSRAALDRPRVDRAGFRPLEDPLGSEHLLSAETAATVVAALAQLEVFRGRAHSAGRLLARCEEELQESAASPVGAVEEVRRRLARQATPWWCTDPRTGWPGRSWWVRQTTG